MPSTATTGTHLPSWAFARRRVAVDGVSALHVTPHLYGSAGTRGRAALVAPCACRHGLNDARSRRGLEMIADSAPAVEATCETCGHAVLSECAAATVTTAGGSGDLGASQSETTANSAVPQRMPVMTATSIVAGGSMRTAANDSVMVSLTDVVAARDVVAGPGLIGYAGGELADRHGAREPRKTETASLVAPLPRKTSDQFTAKRHPPSAPRVAQCVELFKQLRGDAVYQVYAARIALAHNIGGPTAVSAVTLLEGPGTNGD